MSITTRLITIEDYDDIYALWCSTEQSKRALNPVDDSREGIERYLKRNPNTCFLALSKDGSGDAPEVVGVILTGHDGRRAIIHHLCVHPSYRRQGIASVLVKEAEEALKKEGISKIFGLVFKDNEPANAFWEREGYSLRTNLNYRNKSLNDAVPQGELTYSSQPLQTSHQPTASDTFSSSSGVSFTEVNSFPPAGCTYSNLFIETSSHTGISFGTANGQTPPGAKPVIASTWSREIMLGFVWNWALNFE